MIAQDSSGESAEKQLAEAIAAMMTEAWTPPGFCVPNPDVYPHQWLWDSCFHSVIWAGMNVARALTEVGNALAGVGPTGFVPHMTYWTDPDVHAQLWRRSGTSSITQPPMWGLALSEIAAHGGQPRPELLDAAVAGLVHLLEHRRPSPSGLVPVFHPWETGCDDSARWDSWATAGGPVAESGFDATRWKADKLRLVDALRFDEAGAAMANAEFEVGSIGFSALVAWNCDLLAEVLASMPAPTSTTSASLLRSGRDRIVAAIESRWDDRTQTWWDEPLQGGVRPSSGVRTLDSMLALLVDPRQESFDQLIDPEAFGAPFGPRGAHRAEVTYDPDQYWRGPAWPQLTYLLWRAARQAESDGMIGSPVAESLAASLVAGAARSGLAEYWNPETGQGRGAAPQTWAGLALRVSDSESPSTNS